MFLASRMHLIYIWFFICTLWLDPWGRYGDKICRSLSDQLVIFASVGCRRMRSPHSFWVQEAHRFLHVEDPSTHLLDSLLILWNHHGMSPLL